MNNMSYDIDIFFSTPDNISASLVCNNYIHLYNFLKQFISENILNNYKIYNDNCDPTITYENLKNYFEQNINNLNNYEVIYNKNIFLNFPIGCKLSFFNHDIFNNIILTEFNSTILIRIKYNNITIKDIVNSYMEIFNIPIDYSIRVNHKYIDIRKLIN